MKSFPLSRVYSLLEPGPVTLVSTAQEGRVNLMTMSWHTMLDFESLLIGCVISNRNYTFSVSKTIHHCDNGIFMIPGKILKLRSKKK